MADASVFETVWERVREHQGETFRTITGLEFRYTVRGWVVTHDRARGGISKSAFSKAWEQWPVSGPGAFANRVRGSAYVWAILSESRISALV